MAPVTPPWAVGAFPFRPADLEVVMRRRPADLEVVTRRRPADLEVVMRRRQGGGHGTQDVAMQQAALARGRMEGYATAVRVMGGAGRIAHCVDHHQNGQEPETRRHRLPDRTTTSSGTVVSEDAYEKYRRHKAKHEEYSRLLAEGPEGRYRHKHGKHHGKERDRRKHDGEWTTTTNPSYLSNYPDYSDSINHHHRHHHHPYSDAELRLQAHVNLERRRRAAVQEEAEWEAAERERERVLREREMMHQRQQQMMDERQMMHEQGQGGFAMPLQQQPDWAEAESYDLREHDPRMRPRHPHQGFGDRRHFDREPMTEEEVGRSGDAGRHGGFGGQGYAEEMRQRLRFEGRHPAAFADPMMY